MAKKEINKPKYALPYEKQITSQHGEDGIIEVMLNSINVERDYTFLEIGWGDGGTNMTWHLMEQQGWSGVGIDGRTPRKGFDRFPKNFKHYQEFVYPYTCKKYLKDVPLDCDFFSLDIDSFDYEIAKTMLQAGFRPKTVCVEINKNFGCKSIASFPYVDISKGKVYHKLFFNGVSLAKYKKLFRNYGYEFFTVDTSIVNAMFYKIDACDDSLKSLPVLDENYVSAKDSVLEWFQLKQAPKERLNGLIDFWYPRMKEIWRD